MSARISDVVTCKSLNGRAKEEEQTGRNRKKKTTIENRKKPHVLQRSLTGSDGYGGDRFMACVRRGYNIIDDHCN